MHEEIPAETTSRPRRLGFLISGGAEHVLLVAEAIASGRLAGCEIAIVVCNIPGAPGAEAARQAGVQTVTMEARGLNPRDHEAAVDALMRRMRVDIVCLAGYLRKLSVAFLRHWPNRVLAVHGSLLPAFARPRPAREAVEFGVRLTGCTVYVVDERMEGGVVLEQQALAVEEEETEQSLLERLVPLEAEAYINALERFVSGEWEIDGRRYRRKPRELEARLVQQGEW